MIAGFVTFVLVLKITASGWISGSSFFGNVWVAMLSNIIGAPGLGILAFYGIYSFFSNLQAADDRRRRDEEHLKAEEQSEKERLIAVAEREKERLRREEENHQATQRTLELRLSSLMSNSAQLIGNLPKLVRDAEDALNTAEQEFKDGVFAPFWDAIERAANKLATFQSHIQRITQNVTSYKGEATMLETPHPHFQIAVSTLPDASRTVLRMNSIIRPAQKNFEFANIYELHKMNRVLIAGFTTLGQAIYNLGNSLRTSLDELKYSVNDLGDSLHSSLDGIETAISDASYAQQQAESDLLAEAQLSGERSVQDSEARREHERKELKMLDNIQRRKKP